MDVYKCVSWHVYKKCVFTYYNVTLKQCVNTTDNYKKLHTQ